MKHLPLFWIQIAPEGTAFTDKELATRCAFLHREVRTLFPVLTHLRDVVLDHQLTPKGNAFFLQFFLKGSRQKRLKGLQSYSNQRDTDELVLYDSLNALRSCAQETQREIDRLVSRQSELAEANKTDERTLALTTLMKARHRQFLKLSPDNPVFNFSLPDFPHLTSSQAPIAVTCRVLNVGIRGFMVSEVSFFSPTSAFKTASHRQSDFCAFPLHTPIETVAIDLLRGALRREVVPLHLWVFYEPVTKCVDHFLLEL